MKNKIFRFALILCFLVNNLNVAPTPVKAAVQGNTEFIRITNQSTAIYSDKNLSDFLFYLPYTYYVKIIEDYDYFLHIECFDGLLTPTIDGYIKKEDITSERILEQDIYSPFLEITVSTATSTVLYLDLECKTSSRLIFADRKLGYYGLSCNTDGEYLFYVNYLGTSGYVKEHTINPFEVPLHPIPLKKPEQTDKDTEQTKIVSNKTLKLAIIVSLLLAGVIGFFSVVSKKTAKNLAVGGNEETD